MNLLIVAVALGLTLPAAAAEIRVIDGDTFAIDDEHIRIRGIDAPELRGRCRYETRLALEAKGRLAEILHTGRVSLRRDGRDRWGRTLAWVSVGGADVGEALIAAGLARRWTGRREPWC